MPWMVVNYFSYVYTDAAVVNVNITYLMKIASGNLKVRNKSVERIYLIMR